MKKAMVILFIFTSIYLNSANSSIISANLDVAAPFTLTSQINVVADFGISGSNINMTNLDFSFVFDTNILDANNSVSILYDTSASNRIGKATISLEPRSQITFNLNDLYINENGLSFLSISATSDGVNITDISLSGNATIVPLPSTILLLTSGIFALFGYSKKR